MEKITIYTDGACRGNGKENNIGGWGVVLEYKGTTKELKGGTRNTTNNQMEIQSAIEALRAIKDKTIETVVYSDSNYLVSGISTWIYQWYAKGWINSAKKPVENKELWMELLKEKTRFYKIDFIHVKGHGDNQGNNRADALANEFMDELEKERYEY
jgi:ribonuclease HI